MQDPAVHVLYDAEANGVESCSENKQHCSRKDCASILSYNQGTAILVTILGRAIKGDG